jgi:hypothetical protein
LLHVEGFTLRGAQRALAGEVVEGARPAEGTRSRDRGHLVQRLEALRAILANGLS